MQALLRVIEKTQEKVEEEKAKRRNLIEKYMQNEDFELSEKYMSSDSDS